MNIIAAAILAAAIPPTTNITEQVAILWTAHTNRIARVEEMKAKREAAKERRDNLDRVKANLKKHEARMRKGAK